MRERRFKVTYISGDSIEYCVQAYGPDDECMLNALNEAEKFLRASESPMRGMVTTYGCTVRITY